MTLVALLLAAVAALLHVVIFALESLLWSRPSTWRRFGLRSQGDADTVRPMAFNQGFYNLFLALGAAAGVVLTAVGATAAGTTALVLSLGSMVLAALVLVLSSPKLARAAATQGTAPVLALAALAVGSLLDAGA